MIHFKTVRWRNFLSTGNQFTEIQLDRNPSTLIIGKNGSGKCLRGNTKIDVDFLDADAEKAFLDFMNNK